MRKVCSSRIMTTQVRYMMPKKINTIISYTQTHYTHDDCVISYFIIPALFTKEVANQRDSNVFQNNIFRNIMITKY